jgi:thymidylate synthase (FAD)
MFVRYLGHYGDDRAVVNAARVSMGKQVKEFRPDKDGRLLNFLAKHKHELPFAHPHVSFHFKAPIFVARQLG